MSFFARRAQALALSLLLLGCTDEVTTPGQIAQLPTLEPSTTMAVVQESEGPEPGTVLLTVRVLARDLAIAAYQGSVTFAPGAYEVVSVRTPEGLDGESRVVNPAEAAQGRIRFAAFAVEGFGSDVAFTMVARPKAADAAASVTTELEVVGTPEGQPIEAARIGTSRGLYK